MQRTYKVMATESANVVRSAWARAFLRLFTLPPVLRRLIRGRLARKRGPAHAHVAVHGGGHCFLFFLVPSTRLGRLITVTEAAVAGVLAHRCLVLIDARARGCVSPHRGAHLFLTSLLRTAEVSLLCGPANQTVSTAHLRTKPRPPVGAILFGGASSLPRQKLRAPRRALILV